MKNYNIEIIRFGEGIGTKTIAMEINEFLEESKCKKYEIDFKESVVNNTIHTTAYILYR